MMRTLVGLFCILFSVSAARAQFDMENPKTYVLAGLEVKGAEASDSRTIISLSGLEVGQPIVIPGQQVSDVVKRLWKEGIFSDISISAASVVGDKVFLEIEVKERPRISQFSFQGINKSNADDLREKINFIRGTILTESKRQSAARVIRNFFVEKGFYNVSVDIEEEEDKVLKNAVVVNIIVDKGPRVRINELTVEGVTAFKEGKVKRKLKKVHQKSWVQFWEVSKYVPKTYGEAKDKMLAFYRDQGYRDVQLVSDTVYAFDDKTVNVKLVIDEGIKYYHRNIDWTGNVRYNSVLLGQVLNINKGDVFSREKLDKRLFGDPSGSDVSSLYLDNGYLFFDLKVVEVNVEGDSIDLELRITEGPQATIRKVPLQGNTKTSDFVVRRELRTSPGEKFSRANIIRSQREILALGYFDQEKLGVAPTPNPATGTVDIGYTVEERPSDQLQLQGGWGARFRDPVSGQVIGGGFVGTAQIVFNNFSSRRLFDFSSWRPVPSGDGQRLSLAFQMNGQGFRNISFSFVEPWLGGKKPNSLGISVSQLVFSNSFLNPTLYRNSILTTSIDFGRRLKFPDDFFVSRTSLGYKYYDVVQPEGRFAGFEGVPRAFINALTLRQSFERSSVDAPIYPRSGSIFSFSVEATPPYSLFRGDNVDYASMGAAEKYRFLEYHKWRFNSNWFFRLVGDMVLSAKIEAAYLGSYNRDLGISPFERYFLGGIGQLGQMFVLDGREFIPLRGYPNNSFTNAPAGGGQGFGYPIYNRFVMEVRYPFTLNQSAPVWALAFVEGGNGFRTFREYSPFDLYRSAGVGLRVQLPMVGLLGLDWGYGFDKLPNVDQSQFHFIIGQNF